MGVEARNNEKKTATIAVGASLSNAIHMGGYRMAGLLLPSTMEGVAITFQVCDTESGTYQNLYDDSGNEVSLTVAAGRAIGIDAKAGMLAPWKFIKLRTGSAGAPTVQVTEAADITVVLKG